MISEYGTAIIVITETFRTSARTIYTKYAKYSKSYKKAI